MKGKKEKGKNVNRQIKNKTSRNDSQKKEANSHSSGAAAGDEKRSADFEKDAKAREVETSGNGKKGLKLSRTLTLLLAVALTLIFVGSEIFGEAEKSALKWMAQLNTLPDSKNTVVVINIDDDDYQTLFERKSPLKPDRLSSLLDAISRGKPKVIGIDIDTSDQTFASLKPNPDWAPIVWSQAVDFDSQGEMVCCVDPLAGQSLRSSDKTAPPILPKDEDRVTRRYQLFFEDEGEAKPTFVYQVLSLYDSNRYAEIKDNTSSYFIRFAGDASGSHRQNIKAGELLAMEKDSDWLKEKLEGKIALLGGTYTEARDFNETPLGTMQGVNILGSSIETELTATGLKSPNKWYRFLISLFAASFFIIVFNRYKFKTTIIICLISVVPLTMILSLLIYGSFAGFVYFLPTLFLIIVYMIVEEIKEYQKHAVAESYAIGKETVKSWVGVDENKKS